MCGMGIIFLIQVAPFIITHFPSIHTSYLPTLDAFTMSGILINGCHNSIRLTIYREMSSKGGDIGSSSPLCVLLWWHSNFSDRVALHPPSRAPLSGYLNSRSSRWFISHTLHIPRAWCTYPSWYCMQHMHTGNRVTVRDRVCVWSKTGYIEGVFTSRMCVCVCVCVSGY